MFILLKIYSLITKSTLFKIIKLKKREIVTILTIIFYIFVIVNNLIIIFDNVYNFMFESLTNLINDY